MLLDYASVLGLAGPTPALLLGNGFSIAYSRAFNYRELRKAAHLPAELDAAFGDLETNDFEDLLRWFLVTQRVLERFELLEGISSVLAEHEQRVRSEMIEALTAANPPSVRELTSAEKASAGRFISHFRPIFTLCYDLLLYWLVVQAQRVDAFKPDRATGAFPWHPNPGCDVYWLHGGFHLYEQGRRTYKLVQPGAGSHLLQKVKDNIAAGIAPLVVAEGRPDQKRSRIGGNDYLNAALQRFTATEGAMVTFGASFLQDGHIVDAIVQGGAEKIFIGVHGESGRAAFLKLHPDLSSERSDWRSQLGLPSRDLRVFFWNTQPDTIIWGRPPLD